MAVAERVWFVVSLVTTPCLNPAFVSLSEALRARPVNVVPLRTATVTWPRLTFALDAPPDWPPAPALLAGVVADAGGATVFGFGAGVSSPPPNTDRPTTTAPTTIAAPRATRPATAANQDPPPPPRAAAPPPPRGAAPPPRAARPPAGGAPRAAGAGRARG